MHLLRLPGVYRPQGDTYLLAEVLGESGLRRGSRVLDVGTGTGALAVAAVRAGAGSVVAVDVSVPAVVSASINTLLRGMPVRVAHGDALERFGDERFDAVVSNPPYVPSAAEEVPSRGASRAWEAGRGGRALLDRLCALAPDLLRPGGILLVVHSDLSGVDSTLRQLRHRGMHASVVAQRRQGFGPVLRARAPMLERRGLIEPGQRDEELVVVRGERQG
ncbi:release factor glutamine methyltransferase [Saccharopolyspora erythraea NRRL 2338]|uniref:Methyltransferase n=2 Tax=Saccharopolyspora erythraea TaxID=1836 RepID=A4FHB8_SACEN|nr:HemK2/MTQ2 family protein methyltransferase [Saccharopolyspora erythraea]EQD86849.1 methyltransferase [Saccharopolyspora erythraea D]PFG97143.1 release factor glutamine methyltransferase [Saccharopolyspora erythraea NRRL 2338]QRK87346.1 methyltransferase [Saccharopolyspora erythraea]CAM03443.1 methyltransferase [Saccharopolyspora erythraea NRRL 2338]